MPRLVGPSGSIVGGVAVPAGVSGFLFSILFRALYDHPHCFAFSGKLSLMGLVPFWTFDRLMEECGATIFRAPLFLCDCR